jgi:hypothetical protein
MLLLLGMICDVLMLTHTTTKCSAMIFILSCTLWYYDVYNKPILSPVSAMLYTQPEVAAAVSQRLAAGTRPVRATTAIATAKSKGVKKTFKDSTIDENATTNRGSAFEASKECAIQTKLAKKAKTAGSCFKANETATTTATAATTSSNGNNNGKKRQLRSRNQLTAIGNNNNVNSVANDTENTSETSTETRSKRKHAVITDADTTAAAQPARAVKRRLQ